MQDPPSLPQQIADALGDALFRTRNEAERTEAVERLAAEHPSRAAAILAAARPPEQDLRTAGIESCWSIGPYRIQSRLGRGGFGDVYLAEQTEPVRRRVALKVLKRGMDSEAILQRFEREQQALARMSHEAIAKFFDAGTTASGQPYFAMELVEGPHIGAFCERHKLGLRERIELFCKVCRGVQHAHQKGVLHRDLKPSNVIVADSASGPQPKLIDFGIARAIDVEDADLTQTQTGSVLGTPMYMAPEQLDGDRSAIDTRTDVHALGLLLYELSCCSPPHAELGDQVGDPAKVRERLARTGPARPSQRVAVGSQAEAWRRKLRGDLDWIVQKATAREPERRYASAEDLAQDLERHLAFEPVTAGPPTTIYLVTKFVRRNRGEVLTACLVVMTAVIGGIVSLDYARVANQRAVENQQLLEVAESARGEAQRSAEILAVKVREFDQLKGVSLLGDAKAAAASLQPAWPSQLPALQSWLSQHAAPVARLRASAVAAVEGLERLCEPWSEADRRRDAEGDPMHRQWVSATAAAASLRRARDVRLGRLRFDVPELPAEAAGLSAQRLHAEAEARVSLVAGSRSVHGEEALGLRYALAAREKGRGTPREPFLQIALASACVANGLDAEARRELSSVPTSADPLEQSLSERLATIVLRAVENAHQELARWEQELERLSPLVGRRKTWRFPPDAQAEAFLHRTLKQFDRDVAAFDRDVVASVKRRIRWASFLAVREQDPAFLARAEAARAAIAASPAYAACDARMSPSDLADLEPLGLDAATGLFRFYHLPSAWDGEQDPRQIALPKAGSDGRILVEEGTGIVFVLLPGGDALLGCQSHDPSAPRYDPQRRPDEVLHTVRLDPFLMAMHELTQGQWERLWTFDEAGRLPSRFAAGGPDYQAGVVTKAHPVECFDLMQAQQMLAGYGLEIPTEAQWEYAARGGSDAPWHCPQEELYRHENLADLSYQQSGSTGLAEKWDDGRAIHAPVGSLLPNGYGLHDVLGNVGEWAIDRYGDYGSEVDGDGHRGRWEEEDRLLRGAAFGSHSGSARSARREHASPEFRNGGLGVRVARRLRPTQVAR